MATDTKRTTDPVQHSTADDTSHQVAGGTVNVYAVGPNGTGPGQAPSLPFDQSNTDYFGNFAGTIGGAGPEGLYKSSALPGTFNARLDPSSSSGWTFDYNGAKGTNLVSAVSNFDASINTTPKFAEPPATGNTVTPPKPPTTEAQGKLPFDPNNTDYFGDYAGTIGGTKGAYTSSGLPGTFDAYLDPNSASGWTYSYGGAKGTNLVSAVSNFRGGGGNFDAAGPQTLSSIVDTTQTTDPGSGVTLGSNSKLLDALTNQLGGGGFTSPDSGVGTPSTMGTQSIAPVPATTQTTSNPVILLVIGAAAIGGIIFVISKLKHKGAAPIAAPSSAG
jgi:hypothetical protein